MLLALFGFFSSSFVFFFSFARCIHATDAFIHLHACVLCFVVSPPLTVWPYYTIYPCIFHCSHSHCIHHTERWWGRACMLLLCDAKCFAFLSSPHLSPDTFFITSSSSSSSFFFFFLFLNWIINFYFLVFLSRCHNTWLHFFCVCFFPFVLRICSYSIRFNKLRTFIRFRDCVRSACRMYFAVYSPNSWQLKAHGNVSTTDDNAKL